MPNITPAVAANTDSTTQQTLAGLKAKLGSLPNLFTTLAVAPAALQGYVALSGAVAGGALNARQREQIALVVGQENACEYCLAAHTAIGKLVKLSDAEIAHARAGTAPNAKDAALVALAKSIVTARGNVPAAEMAGYRAAGVTDGEILEVVANVALNILTNYTNHVAGTDIDFPKVDLKLAA